MIIAPGKELFDKAIEKHKEIPTSHFLDLEVGFTIFPVGPAIGEDRKSITPDDGLER